MDEKDFKKLVSLYEDRFSINNSSDCSNNSDDFRIQKHNSKRGPEDESNENNESNENDEDHAIKKPK